VTVAVSDFVLSATEIAFTVTGFDAGTVVGAGVETRRTNRADRGISARHVVHLPCHRSVGRFRYGRRELFGEACCTLAVFGLIVTETSRATVTVAVSDFVLSAAEIALTVTAPAGAVAGAV